ncbi:MAG: cytidine deaminase [Lachnospiraceae bacterium]|nr:cytidine deaminase [Lachnospiraceae bacterium]
MKEQASRELFAEAAEMMRNSYAPYSGFHVGAALLAEDGTVYTGCNVENASYGASNCAERTAFFKAVSEGCRVFRAIAIAGGPGGKTGDFCPPCGICRQVMREFCDPETFEIILGNDRGEIRIFRLKELLPESFGPDQLEGGK